MKSGLLAVVLLLCGTVAGKGQSCLTQEDLKNMRARIESSAHVDSTPSKIDKKLQTELLKMALRQRELLQEVVAKDQENKSDREKLHKFFDKSTAKLCDILKENGWPTSATVGTNGTAAAYYILRNGGTFEMQRDLLPVILAAIKKDPSQKAEFAGLFDRLRVSAGMKQLFGTQAVSKGGFLIVYPVEDEKHLDARRAEFGLPKMDDNIRNLERIYGRPLVKSRQAPTSEHSKELTDSITKALDSSEVDANYVDPGDVIRVETSLVSLNVSVFNSKLKLFVGSLTKEDFRVLEDGKDQTVTYFASTDVPFDLVLLVDLSGSTADKRDLIKQSTLRFIEVARPSDRLAIVTFSDDAKIVSPLTLDRAQLTASVQSMEGLGGSHVWDAVKFTFDNVLGPKTLERRRAVVLMSDGVDGALTRFGPPRGSKITFAGLLEQIRQTDTLVVPIYLDTEGSIGGSFMKDEYENARRTLNLMAQESGGSYYQARKLSDLNGVYEQVINDLGKVYSLGYKSTNPTRDSSWRSVQISIANRPDLVTHARPGYYAQ
ncbi:MAG TPA: VWA domain-containing protein [Pyrinomonadaceae bacterium]|nr:VWA domain-containing protein [Pyrinomonadaceae bacterium]